MITGKGYLKIVPNGYYKYRHMRRKEEIREGKNKLFSQKQSIATQYLI
jgi:hypothetical protein